jgi:hypothetical protein
MGMTTSEIHDTAWVSDALRLIPRRAGHSRSPLKGRESREFWVFLLAKKTQKLREVIACE